jgi:kinesin family protein 18/19
MMGSLNNPGIMSFTLQELFTQIAMKQDDRKLIVKISFFEVYNETIIDLLGEKNSNLDIREDSKQGVFILGIKEYTVSSEDEVMRYLKIGTKSRTMEATSANEVSSRSHAILQVSIESKTRTEGNSQEINYSKLSLIDLAGSERAATTKNTGIRLTEGANINKSLLALSNCITMLVEKLDKGLKSIYIPYRDSKLTRLLKDSLGGNCRTVMIANVTPASICYDDTNNTLKFADKAKKIKTNVKRKVIMLESDHDKYTKIITQLQAENENLRKLLKEQQMNASLYSNFGPRQYSSASGTVFDTPPPFSSNEQMIQEIQSHFEYEMKAYKKLFDLEIIHDEYFLKIKEITQELGHQENLDLRDELSHLITFQRNVLLQIKTARHEADIMQGKRDRLFKVKIFSIFLTILED